MQHQTSIEMQACIDACHDCHMTCLSMAMNHCLEVRGRHVEPQHMRIMLDCAQICSVALDFMARSSEHHGHICRECAEICRACAASCQKVGDMDECVAACLRCAEACEKMAA
ncbi:ferredoxin [Sphingomonas paucimobilis]|uniref:four-helix bundle copper-binding protein n=1 Tax=Sphingomonas paucimobilis TaxID=13689 RepID=UPI00064C0589|nr:four-helix bundle copper-binding protein [Sphingomonas paucimobilis]BCI72012.1 ferredoxin [Sphingomonas paucimobilis]